MQSFDYELERLIHAGIIEREVGLSYSSNRTNLQLRLESSADASELPTIGAADKTVGKPAAKSKPAPEPKNELDDLIER